MKCDRCKISDATVHLKQIVDGNVLSLNLCSECANEAGIGSQIDGELNLLAILDVIAKKATKVGSHGEAAEGEKITDESVCPTCGLTAREFAKTGLLGCPDCYRALSDILFDSLDNMHRDTHHRGRGLAPCKAGSERSTGGVELAHLREELARAVATEAYEEAARLRDRIFAVRQSLRQGGAP